MNTLKYLQRQAQYGTYNSLMIELLELDDVKFCNYVRMPPEEFNLYAVFESSAVHYYKEYKVQVIRRFNT